MRVSGEGPGSIFSPQRVTATASARMLRARAVVTPSAMISSMQAPAMRSGEAGSRVRPAMGVSIGSPNASANRAANVVAPRTLTCWPRIARNPRSKPSNAPGTRSPGSRSTSGPSRGSAPRWVAIAAGSASRSKNPRSLASTRGSTGSRDAAISTRSADAPGNGSAVIQPRRSPTARVRP